MHTQTIRRSVGRCMTSMQLKFEHMSSMCLELQSIFNCQSQPLNKFTSKTTVFRVPNASSENITKNVKAHFSSA